MTRLTFLAFLFAMFAACFVHAQRPPTPQDLFDQAEKEFNNGRYQDALNLLNQCLQLSAGYYEAYPLRAAAREQLRDLDGALTDYSIYLDQFPEHVDVLLSRAIVRYQLGLLDQSREDLVRLRRMKTTETNALFFRKNANVGTKAPIITTNGGHHAHVFNYMGLIELKKKQWQLARQWFDSAILSDAKEPDYYVNRGLAKEALNDSSAMVDYQLALGLNPQHTLARHNLKSLEVKFGNKISAEERLTATIEADSTMLYPYLERAQQRFEGGYYAGARDDYSVALEMDPNNVEIWLGRGLAREKLKDFKGAFSDYTKAIDLKEDYAKAWMNRGNVLLKLERYTDAIEDYSAALVYWADYPLAYYNRGIAKMKLKRNQEACADIKKAQELGMKVEAKVLSRACAN